MEDKKPTIRSRTLGEAMRRAMESAGISGMWAAERLGCSQGHISRLLSGKRGASVEDVSSILTLCGMPKGDERSYLLSLCEDPHRPGWLQQFGTRLPKQVSVLADHEDLANYYADFQPVVIPGLLQTADYSRAVMLGNVNLPENEIEGRVSARLVRAEVLSRLDPATFEFYVHEWVLRTMVGGRVVMCDQLHHLLRLGVRENITIRVMSASVGAYPAMSGPFMIMRFPQFRPVVYLESETSCLFLEEPPEISAYENLLTGLRKTSLDEADSRAMITEFAARLAADREDHDG